MVYAVKSVENTVINKIFTSWDGDNGCKQLVLGKKAVYRSFNDEQEARAFLVNAPVNADNFGRGYIPTQKGKHIMYGRFKFDRCKEKENGFSVKIYETLGGEKFCCVGYHLPDNNRLVYAFTGEFVENPKFGYEFIVDTYTEHITSEKKDVINYLSCGIIKGIGPKKAELIYEKFKGSTLEVLDKTPEKLLAIKGISKNVLKKIVDSYMDSKASREVIYFLLKYGISQKYGTKIFSAYGKNAVSLITENPYIITNVRGLTYEDADRIAKDLGLPLNSKERFKCCALFVLKSNEQSGNCGMDSLAFQKELYLRLGSDNYSKEDIFSNVCDLIKDGTIKKVNLPDYAGEIKQFIFSRNTYWIEKEIAEEIVRIITQPRTKIADVIIQNMISALEKQYHIQLDELQRTAIKTALQSNLCVITGGPGSGKTTIIRFINAIYKALFPANERIFLAPTGRAARIMTESTGEPASTGHSFLHIYEEYTDPEDEILISNALVVGDEFSMADIHLCRIWFRAIMENNTFTLVGDADQLPSVGPGAVLRDLIESNAVPVIRLEKIYRQGEDTEIYENSRKINAGKTDIKEGSDFHFYESASMEDIKHLMGEMYVKRVAEFGLENVMCLCPFRDHIAGVNDMNIYLQSLVNPTDNNKAEITYKKTLYRVGDLVMHTKDNSEVVANGDIGIIESIRARYDKDGDVIEDDFEIYVKVNGQTIVYSKETAEKLVLAYATTVHKSQGSQADAVIVCLTEFHKSMLYRNIPYVAVSRGKKQVDAIGQRSAWNKAILNEDKSKTYRITLTKRFLQLLTQQFVPY